MLKDADPNYFAGIFIVCGYTDLRYGIDSLAAIIERKYRIKVINPHFKWGFKLYPSGVLF